MKTMETLEIPADLLQAIQLAEDQRKAREKLKALDTKVAFSKAITDTEFDEAVKAVAVLTKKNKLSEAFQSTCSAG